MRLGKWSTRGLFGVLATILLTMGALHWRISATNETLVAMDTRQQRVLSDVRETKIEVSAVRDRMNLVEANLKIHMNRNGQP